jgi:hypothetical protein
MYGTLASGRKIIIKAEKDQENDDNNYNPIITVTKSVTKTHINSSSSEYADYAISYDTEGRYATGQFIFSEPKMKRNFYLHLEST